MTRNKHITHIALVTAAALFAACTDNDDLHTEPQVPTVGAKLTFALPQSIVVAQPPTRMAGDVVQLEESSATFRGLDNLRLLCFDAMPTATSRSTGGIISMASTGGRQIDLATENDYSIVRQVRVPIGTTHFAFYATAIESPTTHADYMHYGRLATSGLDSYSGNSDIAFSPVAICNSAAEQGGSTAGQALVAMLNNLMQTTSTDPAPDDQWRTAPDERLHAAYQAMTEMKTLSTANVERLLGKVYKIVNNVPADYAGYQLSRNIVDAIAAVCATPLVPGSELLTLKDEYQGFPADINLPEGAARIEWNASTQKYVTPAAQVYGRGLNIPAMTDYVYPANLQYMVTSPIVASDSLALPGDPLAELAPTDSVANGSKVYTNWQQLINDAYATGYNKVKETTQSVAMVNQVQYAVGRIDSRVSMESNYLYDANGKAVNATAGFTLKGYLVAGQREVGYDFMPKASAHEYVIYDTDLNGGPQHVVYGAWTTTNYTLALTTDEDASVLIALELVNDGPDFQGADGLIAHGATFYLVANMEPQSASNYISGTRDRIVHADHRTNVKLKIMQGHRDVDGDGVPDTDMNGDGVPDRFVKDWADRPTGLDVDGDGTADAIDSNHDGIYDVIVALDTNSDGIIDRIGWDINGDGKIDKEIERNSDSTWPDTPTVPSGLATATYGIPDLTEPEVHRPLGLSVDLSWGQGMVFPEIPLGVKERK